MSLRPAAKASDEPTALLAGKQLELSEALKALLTLDDLKGTEGYKRPREGPDEIEKLGLLLKNPYYPRVSVSGLGIRRLGSVTLFRENNGAKGVYFTDYATVLIISADSSKYLDKYGEFLRRAKAGFTTAMLPQIEYAFPAPDLGKPVTKYIQNGRAHLASLAAAATKEKLGTHNWTYSFEQPHTKIFIFFKIPATGIARFSNQGQYLCLGRFAAVERTDVLSAPFKKPEEMAKSLVAKGGMTSIYLKAFDPPAPPKFLERDVKPSVIQGDDLQKVVDLTTKK
jgi:hypothetical protein